MNPSPLRGYRKTVLGAGMSALLAASAGSAAIVNGSFTINSAALVDWYSATFDPALVPCGSPPGSPPYDAASCAFFGGYSPATRAVTIAQVGTGSGTLNVQYDNVTGEVTQVNSLEIFLPKLTFQVTTFSTTVIADPALPAAPGFTYLRAGTLGQNATADADEGTAVGVAAVFRHDDNPTLATVDFAAFSTTADSCSGTVCGLFLGNLVSLDGMRYQLDGSIPGGGPGSFVLRGQNGDNSIYRVNFTTAGSPDADSDGLADAADNCTLLSNPTQCDSDADGYGNRCDGDLNNNNATNAQDTTVYRQQLGQPSVAPTFNKADINCSGAVNAQDSTLFRQLLGSPPGPSGLHP
jgi:hypothetical protein